MSTDQDRSLFVYDRVNLRNLGLVDRTFISYRLYLYLRSLWETPQIGFHHPELYLHLLL